MEAGTRCFPNSPCSLFSGQTGQTRSLLRNPPPTVRCTQSKIKLSLQPARCHIVTRRTALPLCVLCLPASRPSHPCPDTRALAPFLGHKVRGFLAQSLCTCCSLFLGYFLRWFFPLWLWSHLNSHPSRQPPYVLCWGGPPHPITL